MPNDLDAPSGHDAGMLAPATYAALVRRASGIVCLLDAAGTLRFVGESVTRELGRSPSAELGCSIEGWLDPEHVERWRDVWRRALAGEGEGPHRAELRVRRQDGAAVWMSASLQDLRDDPDVARVFLNLRDVSALKRSETLLARQRAELERSGAVRDRLMALVEDALTRRGDGFEARLLAHAVEMVPGADAGSVLVRDDDDRLRYRAAVGYELAELKGVSFELAELSDVLSGTAPQPVRYHAPPDAARRERLETAGRRGEIRATLAVPVVMNGQMRAVLNLDALRSADAFDRPARELATVFASHLALVLERLELEARAERSHRHQRLLARSQRLLLETAELDAFLPAFARLLLDGDDAVIRVGVYRLRGARLDYELYGPDDPELARRMDVQDVEAILDAEADTAMGRTLRSRRATYLPDVRLDPGWRDLGDGVIRSALMVPVTVRDRVWGLFDLVSDRIGGFDTELRELVEQVATGVSLALERQAAREDLERRLGKLRAVVSANRVLYHARDQAEVHSAAVRAVRRRLSAAYAVLLAPGNDGGFFARFEDRDPDDPEPAGRFHYVGRAERVWRDATTVHVDLEQDAEPSCAFVGTPVLGGDGRPIAVLAAVVRAPTGFDDADVAFLEAVAQAASAALARLGLLERAEREAEAYRALARFGAAIEEVNDPDRLLELGVRDLQNQLGLPFAHYHVFGDGRWWPRRWWGDVPQALLDGWRANGTARSEGMIGHAARTGRLAYLEDYASWSGRIAPAAPHVGTAVALPIARGGRVESVLAFHAADRHPLGADRLAVARNFLRRLENALERADNLAEVESTREATLRALGLMLEHRDFETKGHTDRVVALSERFAVAARLGSEDRLALRWGAYLHDIGKVAVPDAILLKPGRLDPDEFAVIRTHAVIGATLTDDIGFLPIRTREVVRSHHERWDGSGYPDGLAGTSIPRLARMFALVDVWDALTSVRPYKPAWSDQAARREIEAGAGTQFDPSLVPAFLELVAGAG